MLQVRRQLCPWRLWVFLPYWPTSVKIYHWKRVLLIFRGSLKKLHLGFIKNWRSSIAIHLEGRWDGLHLASSREKNQGKTPAKGAGIQAGPGVSFLLKFRSAGLKISLQLLSLWRYPKCIGHSGFYPWFSEESGLLHWLSMEVNLARSTIYINLPCLGRQMCPCPPSAVAGTYLQGPAALLWYLKDNSCLIWASLGCSGYLKPLCKNSALIPTYGFPRCPPESKVKCCSTQKWWAVRHQDVPLDDGPWAFLLVIGTTFSHPLGDEKILKEKFFC